MTDAARSIPAYPDDAQGRGIVICGGGAYAFSALITLAIIRDVGCNLPVEIWGFDQAEFPDWFVNETAKLNATLCRADQYYDADPVRGIYDRDRGWTLKAYAILHSRFREILYFDADSYPVRDPSDLFERPEYIEHGAIFWPDSPETGGTDFPDSVWQTFGIAPRSEPEFEAGQFIVDKARCWKVLRLLNWMNQHSDFYYWFDRQNAYGDKALTHLAWRYLGMDYGMPPKRPDYLQPAMLHYDFNNEPLFVHRVKGKFTLVESLDQYAVFKTTHQEPDRFNIALPLEKTAWEIESRYLPLVPKPEMKKMIAALPTSWGSQLWDMFHRRPAGCEDLAEEPIWLMLFARKIPCGDCRDHWEQIIKAHPPDLSSRFAYAKWQHARHNDVNVSKQIPSPTMSWFDAAMKHQWWTITDGMPNRLAIATLWTQDIADVAAITLPTKARYAVRQGLPYIEHYGAIREERPPAWSKLPLLIEHLPKYDWIFWTDADAMFMQDMTDLRDMLDDDADLIWTEDHNGPNTGAFFIRNSAAGMELLKQADSLFQVAHYDNRGRFRGLWEQGALRYLVENQIVPVRVKTLPKRSINSYETDYETGDLIVHFPAHDKMERIKNFLERGAA